MKKITSILALVLTLVLCIGTLAACSGGEKDPTNAPQKPGTTTGANKDEGKPEATKPEASKPENDTETQPEGGETEDEAPEQGTDSETQPENGNPDEGETEEDATTDGGNTDDTSADE